MDKLENSTIKAVVLSALFLLLLSIECSTGDDETQTTKPEVNIIDAAKRLYSASHAHDAHADTQHPNLE